MKMLTVLRYELVTLIRKPGYLVLGFGLPILGLIIVTVISLSKDGVEVEQQPPQQLELEGFVDHADLIGSVPEGLPLTRFETEDQARQALADGEVAAFYVVPGDYVESGQLIYVHPSLNPLASNRQDWIIRRTLLFNLLGADPELTELIWNPVNLEVTDLAAVEAGSEGDCSRPGANCESNVLIRLVPMFILVYFFVALTNGSAMLLRSVSAEKQNRVIEVLASSVSPLQLMTGKIAGLGIGTLLAFGFWVFAFSMAMRIGRPALGLPVDFAFPRSMLPWSVLFFLLGYALYASLMAGIGALVPNIKEVTGASWIVMAPMMVGYMVGIFGIERPHSMLMIFLSLFPMTSPLVMVQRLTVGGVPAWQPILAAILLLLAIVLAVRAAARLFRAHHLLSGQSFSPRRLVAALRA
jgi:ABC-2 type transport system permease protein